VPLASIFSPAGLSERYDLFKELRALSVRSLPLCRFDFHPAAARAGSRRQSRRSFLDARTGWAPVTREILDDKRHTQ
jgi:hypothetical protein